MGRRRRDDDPRQAFLRTLVHPGVRDAVLADARATAAFRGERADFRPGLDTLVQLVRLAWVTDAFLAQALYRVKTGLQSRRVPVLPALAHRLAMMVGQVSIGDPVVIGPGLYLAHGQVVVDGIVEIAEDVVIFPWVTIGLRAGDARGATIEAGATIGSGAKVVGPVRIGAGATVGANAVVVDDVPAGATVVGAPARPVARS